jgi:hypothetical protein
MCVQCGSKKAFWSFLVLDFGFGWRRRICLDKMILHIIHASCLLPRSQIGTVSVLFYLTLKIEREESKGAGRAIAGRGVFR